jgi:hypothetical protein
MESYASVQEGLDDLKQKMDTIVPISLWKTELFRRLFGRGFPSPADSQRTAENVLR